MSLSVLLSRAIALHRPYQPPVALRPFSTIRPGTKQKRDRRRTPSKQSDASLDPRISDTPHFQSEFLAKGGSKPAYEGPPILIPPGKKHSMGSLPHAPYDRSRSRLQGEEAIVHALWTANVSPLLDPNDFCKKSAAHGGTYSRNGTLAARRLLEGKKKVLEELRDDVLKSSKTHRKPPRAYAIIGHGVPKQLLQSHVTMADLLLIDRHAAEISFKNSAGELSFETLRARSRDGHNRVVTFDRSKSGHDMQLYLTVMNRISCVLSQVLWHDNPVPVYEEKDDDFVQSSSTSAAKLLHWNVELLRGAGNPPVPMLTPIVQWTPPEGDSVPGQMCVQLRGLPIEYSQGAPLTQRRRRRKPVEVTLTFRSYFQNPAQKDLN